MTGKDEKRRPAAGAAADSPIAKLRRERLVQLVGTCDRALAHLPSLAGVPRFAPSGLDIEGLRHLPRRRLERLLRERLGAVVDLVRTQEAAGGIQVAYRDLFEAVRQGAEDLGVAYRQVIFELQSLLPFWSGGATRSGAGSTLAATAALRAALPALLARYEIDSILDAACGDFHWARHVAWGQVRYIGVDVVADIVEENRKRFSSPRLSFERADIVNDELPAARAILCRDCLFHLSVDDVCRTIENFKRTGAQFLLTSTSPNLAANRAIPTGYYHPINLQIAPYGFPPPLDLVADAPPDKYLGWWRQDDLPRLRG